MSLRVLRSSSIAFELWLKISLFAMLLVCNACSNSGGNSGNTGNAGEGNSASTAAPTNLAATAGNQQANLTWRASSGATSYYVKRGTVSGGPYTTVGTPTATTYADTKLTNGTAYYYVVTAVGVAGESADSNQASATPTAAPAAPVPPLNLTATGGNQQVSLAWTASTGATSYNVKRASTNGGPYTTVGTPAGTSYTDTAVTNGTAYYYVVTAVNAAGQSGNSNQATATPMAAPTAPVAPLNLTATGGNQQVSLAWTASTGASSYHVKRAATNGGPYTTVASPAGTSYTDTSVTNGTTYYYVVTAVSSNGESANSNQASATPTAPGTSSCALPISAVKTAGNTNVVGDGTPASCTESAFEEAVAAGGVVTFNCGAAPYRLVLSSTKSITQGHGDRRRKSSNPGWRRPGQTAAPEQRQLRCDYPNSDASECYVRQRSWDR